jgi:glycosyltransferase involved in cell wall biosynthesis
VTIVMPCHNAEPFLRQALESVRCQTFVDWELVFVDDGSTDRSASIASSFAAEEPRLRIVRQPRSGVCAARNYGWRVSGSLADYFYFFDADDVLAPNMLQIMVEYLDTHPQVVIAFCDYEEVDLDGRSRGLGSRMPRFVAKGRWRVRQLREDEPNTPFESIYCWAPVMEAVSVLRRGVLERTTGWDEQLGQHGEGVDLFLQFAAYGEVHYVPHTLYYYRHHEGQSTSDPARMAQQQSRVYDKWRYVPVGVACTQERLDAARHFRERRLLPILGLRSGWARIRRGRIAAGLRFWAGALRRLIGVGAA